MTEQFTNFAQGALAAPITAIQNIISITPTAIYPSQINITNNFPKQGNFRIVVQSFDITTQIAISAPEIMIVTSVAGNSFTVQRGAENTNAMAFSSGAMVTHIATAAVMTALASGGGGVSSLNILTGNITLTSSSGTITITPSGSTIDLEASASAPTFNLISSGTNTTAAMVVGSGASLSAAGSGIITATTAGTVSTISGLIAQGTNVTITGSGTSASPYTISASGGGGNGTVTSVSVVTANGLAGTVANPTTTPAITLTTTITGLLKGDGSAISPAIADTDYQSPITLTTSGTSGAATFIGDTLNIPQYSGGGGGGTSLGLVYAFASGNLVC